MDNAFSKAGRWYRGNLHMHSTESDGKLSKSDAIEWYKARGYDFISLTDHRKTVDTVSFNTEDFLVIPGLELDCVDDERQIGYHIVSIGNTPFSQPEETRKGPGQGLVDTILAHGGQAIMAHPYWLGQDSRDISAVEGAFGIEVFNTTCGRPGKAYGMVHWDGILDRGHRLWGLATDDAHRYTDDAGGGWVMVKAKDLTEAAILTALREGDFYATQGPAILDFRRTNDHMHVHVSPVKEIRFISNRGRGLTIKADPNQKLTTARCPVPTRGYMRVECIDEDGLYAWSQPIFFD